MTDDIREEWEPLVGRYILICGDIELALCQLYWNLMLGKTQKININKKSFKEKAIEIRDILKNNRSETLEKLIERVITVTDKRNIIAHNPLYLDVYMNSDGGFNYIKTIRSLRDNSKHITIDNLSKEIEKAKLVSQELIEQVMNAGGFRGENS